MNIPASIAKQALDGLKNSPALLAVVLVYMITLAGFVFVLNEVSSAIERREVLLKACIERRWDDRH